MLSASMVSTSSRVSSAVSSQYTRKSGRMTRSDVGRLGQARTTPGGGPDRQIAPDPRSPAPEDRTSIGVAEALPTPLPPDDLPDDLLGGPFPGAHGSNGRCFQPAWFPPPPE